ncbi:type I secretion system permease/ATPase [Ramlibacter sp. AW1]|uniref:Type I secretion system permease/ATPase n=1 Tax=Ramlibacter aurantiacus TaxID=2801330 RepID=A0A936ZUY3_9BURK|nr:type I secretion system permease/ATPase [Ramlibacter aurantiacus]MBL0423056.1 type I secretion system permease/ATPase [Ramlibacter aurantiacus]
MRPILRHLRQPVVHAAVFSLFMNLLMLIPAVFMLQVFDRVLVSRSTDTLLVLGVGAALGLAMLLLLDYVRARLQGLAGAMLSESLTPTVAAIAVARRARSSGPSGIESLRDIGTLRAAFSAQGLLALLDAPWMAVYVALIWLAHPYLGMIALASSLLLIALALVADLSTRSRIEALARCQASASRYLESSLANAEVIHTLGMTGALVTRWRRMMDEAGRIQPSASHRTVAIAALTRTLRQGVQILMLAVGAWLVISGRASPGVTIACTILLGRALAPVEQLTGSWKLLTEARAAWRRITALLDGARAEAPAMPLPAPTGRLSAQQLTFRAPGQDRLLVAGVSFQLEPGESMAILGPSGAGKSSLLRLLSGVWQPCAGIVRLDGSDLAQWSRADVGPWLGYVPQDVELFAGTVAENIARLGEVDGDMVVQAATRAHVHEMIQGLPNGYNTVIDPLGPTLSPGQRQRIALARALYGDPRVLILDEPNSNLDGAGEQALAQCLRSLKGRVTTLVVTHRTALLQQVDKMLVIEGGRPLHCGPVAQVLKAMQAQQASGAKVVTMPMPAVSPGLAAGGAQ